MIHAALLGGPKGETFSRAARLDCFRAAPVAGLPAVGRYRTARSAKAAAWHEGMQSHSGKLQRRESD